MHSLNVEPDRAEFSLRALNGLGSRFRPLKETLEPRQAVLARRARRRRDRRSGQLVIPRKSLFHKEFVDCLATAAAETLEPRVRRNLAAAVLTQDRRHPAHWRTFSDF
jgi:hypothetical protein